MESKSSPVLARQPSGIRATPTYDDDDYEFDDNFDANLVNENDNSVDEFAKINESNKNLRMGNDNSSSNGSSKSSESSSISSSNTSFSSGNTGSMVNGGKKDEELESAEGIPDKKFQQKIARNGVSNTGSVVGSPRVPVAKVSGEGDDDDDEIEVGIGEEDGGQVQGSYGVRKVIPRVRVLDEEVEEEEGEEEWGDTVERPKVETREGAEGEREEVMKTETREVDESDREKGQKMETTKAEELDKEEGPKVETRDGNEGEREEELKEETLKGDMGDREEEPKVETPIANEGEGEEQGVELSEVGSHAGKVEENADATAPVSEGKFVKKSTYPDVVASGSDVAEDREDKEESEVGGKNEETPAIETPSADSAAASVEGKYMDEGDAVVDSINVDAAEAVRSGTAVVGELEEMKDSGTELESSVVENAAQVIGNSGADDSAPEESKLIKNDEKKSDGEESVVDGINVDVREAVRSGVAAVGDSEVGGTGPEVKDDQAPVPENVTSANDFAPLDAVNSSEIVNVDGEQQKASLTNEAEAPQHVKSVEQQDMEETQPEAAIQSKQQEPTNEQQSNFGAENEKAQPLDDEPDANAALAGGVMKDRSYANAPVDGLDDAASDGPSPAYAVDAEDEKVGVQEEGDDEGLGTDEEDKPVYFGSGSSSNKIMELESHDRSEMVDGQVVTDSEDEGESDEEGEGKELFDSAAFAALLKAATSSGSDPGTITITSQDGSRLFSVERPAGLGPSLRSVRPAQGPRDPSFISPSSAAATSEEDLSEEEKNKLRNLQQLKVKFLRLVQRVGFTAENSVAAQVLYKLSFFGGRPAFPAFSLDNAKQTAMQLEAEGKDDLNFSMTILVLGKTGVGKSAIINSILLEEKVKINAFEPETTSVTEICGMVDGVKVRFIDVPGLKSSAVEQGYNRKVLESVKKITKKNPIDVVFYVDRLDSQTRDLNDLPMLRTITNSLGSSIWRNTIITLTHASSAPPDGPSGTPLSYEVFVAQRSHIVQQSIGQAVGDLRLMNLNMMSPVSLVENHPACRKNREGQKVLPNGQAWRPQLLVLCYSVKILSEATAAAKPQDPIDSRKLFGFRVRSPPLPYLLSSLLQPRAHPKLSADQGGDNVDSDIDLDDLSDSDQEDEVDEYDQLPPFKPLRKSQIAKLSGEQRKAYFEEYDYRVKLLQKKQWKEELKRMREMKKGKTSTGAYGEMPEDYDGENGDGDNGAPAAVPVPMPDMALPPSFDSDNPAYRYRFLEPTSQFLARPVLDTHGWDHDCGYDGVNIEQNLGIAGRFPAAVTAQVTKDKKDFNIHLDSAVSAKHGENGSSLVGFDVQSIGKQYAYIIKGESKFKNLKKNKTTAGVSVTFLGENVASGVKVEDQITLGKRLVLVGSTGTVRSQKDAAYGANLEVRLREADYPIGQEQSSFTLSLMKWRGDLAIGGNLQSQISVGRNSKMALRVALNNKQSGQITVKTSSSDHLSLAIAGLVPIALSIYQKFIPGVSESYSIY